MRRVWTKLVRLNLRPQGVFIKNITFDGVGFKMVKNLASQNLWGHWIVIATLWWGRCGKEVKTNTIQESQPLILLVPFYLRDTLEENLGLVITGSKRSDSITCQYKVVDMCVVDRDSSCEWFLAQIGLWIGTEWMEFQAYTSLALQQWSLCFWVFIILLSA